MQDLGLTTRPNRRSLGPQPVNLKKWHEILRDPYYAGYVTYEGERYPGRHEPLINEDLFDAVQNVLALRSKSGTRDRVHNHYLRGLMFCDRCFKNGHQSRLIYTQVSGRSGKYEYYVCSGRANFGCTLPHLQIPLLERAILEHHESISPPEGFVEALRNELASAVRQAQQTTSDLRLAATKQLAEIDQQEERLIDALAEGDLPAESIRKRLNRRQTERQRLEGNRAEADTRLAVGAQALDTALQMMLVPEAVYEHASDDVRREINRAFFERVFIDEHGDVIESDLVPPVQFIVDAYREPRPSKRPDPKVKALAGDVDPSLSFLRDCFTVPGSNKGILVELRGSPTARCARSGGPLDSLRLYE